MTSIQGIKKLEEQLALAKEKYTTDFLQKKGYVIQQKLGSGSFAEVFKAIQTKENQIVALKRLKNMKEKNYSYTQDI